MKISGVKLLLHNTMRRFMWMQVWCSCSMICLPPYILYKYGKEGNICRNLEISHGHTNISVTLNVYTHLKLEDAEKEIKRLEKEHMIKR